MRPALSSDWTSSNLQRRGLTKQAKGQILKASREELAGLLDTPLGPVGKSFLPSRQLAPQVFLAGEEKCRAFSMPENIGSRVGLR